jgi:hypothetical protein
MIAKLLLVAALALLSGCVLVPVGPPVFAEPAVVVPAPVVVAPGYRAYRGYYGGYRGGYYGRYR